MSRTRCAGDACGFRCFFAVLFSPRMRGQLAAAVSLPLPEDRLLCAMRTGVQELRSRYQEAIARSRLLRSPARLPCWHCVYLLSVRAGDQTTHSARLSGVPDTDAGLFCLFCHRMTSAVISTMTGLPGKWRKPPLRKSSGDTFWFGHGAVHDGQ